MALAIAAVLSAGCQPESVCGEFPLDDGQRECVVRTIDEMVAESYPFEAEKGIDLDEFSRRLWATLDSAEGKDDRRFLSDVNYVISMLEDGHTRMEQQLPVGQGVAPMEVERQDDQLMITRVDDDVSTDLIGRHIEEIDGVDVRDALGATGEWTRRGEHRAYGLSGSELAMAGDVDAKVRLTMADGETVELSRRSRYETPQVRHLGDNIGYLRLETFGFIDDLDRVDEALNEVIDTRALIIDLRGNGGGFPSVSEGLFARLIDEESPSFRMVDVDGRLHRELEMEPRGETYDGEVVVLVDGGTYSASNFFVHRMTYHDRGILVGRRTGGGAASPAKGEMLVPGVWFQVSTYVVRAPDGQHTESGITPTIPVSPRQQGGAGNEVRQQVTDTGDPIMDRALRYLEGLE